MIQAKLLSIVVPLYNEQENVPILVDRIVTEVSGGTFEFEIICVDDGSSDDTFKVLKNLAHKNKHLKVIKFRKNCGQTPAMVAGIKHALGDVVVTMDGDLQNDPSDIKTLVAKIDEGYDIVVGWRYKRQDKLISRKIPSVIANWIIGKVTGVPIKDNGCSLKAYRAEIIKNVPLYSEMHRFIPAMASITGSKIAQVRVKHHARQFGESKYGLSRVYKVIIDLMTIKMISSFKAKPLVWFSFAAIIPILIFMLISLLYFVMLFMGYVVSPLVLPGVSALSLLLAVFLFFNGALAELIYKTGNMDIYKLRMLTATEEI